MLAQPQVLGFLGLPDTLRVQGVDRAHRERLRSDRAVKRLLWRGAVQSNERAHLWSHLLSHPSYVHIRLL